MYKLAIVVPCYKEEEVLEICSEALRGVLNDLAAKGKITEDSFVMFVNDGSKDSTWEIIKKLSKENSTYLGISQSRNRGHQNSVLAGLMEAKDKCDITISIDCDGQDDINAIDWSLKAENLDLFAYYQGLIAMRKAHPAFHMGDADLVRANVHFLEAPAGVVAYQLNGEAVGDEWKTIIVILNSQLSTINYQLPEGEYHVAVADGKCPAAAQGLLKGSAKVAAQSAMVLYL